MLLESHLLGSVEQCWSSLFPACMRFRHLKELQCFGKMIHYGAIGNTYDWLQFEAFPDSRCHGATWGPPGSCRPQIGPVLAPWTLLSGLSLITSYDPTWLRYVVISHISLHNYDLIAVTVKHGPNTNFHLQRHYTQCCFYLNSLWIHIERPYNLRHM